jgi:Ran GTPase-activating protein (RanGAP) involved in mRNA processing and transport
LVFADWLDERGGEEDRARAALIRAQCRLENLPQGSTERTKLEREARRILRKYEGRWTKELRRARFLSDLTFRRGFLDGGSTTPTTFVQRGGDFFRLAPTLRTLRFPNAANELTELAESPFLARLTSVDLTYMCTCGMCMIDDELRDLFKSKHATNLRCLSVSRDRIDAEGASALARAKVLANLTELDLSRNPLEAQGLQAFVRAKHFGKLAALNLAHTSLQNAGAEVLAGAMNFPALVRLDVSGNNIRATGAARLAASPLSRQLAVVNLADNRIGEGGSAALANLPADAKLESLDVSGNNLSAKAVARLKARFGSQVKV